jgi:hypothetical protein
MARTKLNHPSTDEDNNPDPYPMGYDVSLETDSTTGTLD